MQVRSSPISKNHTTLELFSCGINVATLRRALQMCVHNTTSYLLYKNFQKIFHASFVRRSSLLATEKEIVEQQTGVLPCSVNA